MAAKRGSKINPYSVTFTNARTVSEFNGVSYNLQLRRGVYDGAVWFWLRMTMVYGTNDYPVAAKMDTPAGNASGPAYGSLVHSVSGSSGVTAAVCQGNPAGAVTVTYSGTQGAYTDSKNALAS